jgi:hypothetical protein
MIEEFEFPNGADEDLQLLETPRHDMSVCALCGWPLPREDWYCSHCLDLAYQPLRFDWHKLPSSDRGDPVKIQAIWACRNITRRIRCQRVARMRNNVMK